MKRTWPFALDSSGPVKISPLGMLRVPSELTHRRPLTDSRRSVPGASMRSSRAPATRSISCPGSRAARARRATGSGWSRNIARRTNAANCSSAIPACRAPAGVGQSVEHQRFSASPRAAARRARATRAISAGSTSASSRSSCGAWMPSSASSFLARARLEVVELVELGVARVAVEARRLAGQLDARTSATPRARGSRAAARAAAAARASSSARRPSGAGSTSRQ